VLGVLGVRLGGWIYALWRNPRFWFLAAGFFVILSPSSSVVPLVSQTIAEHRMYLPLAAVVTLAVIAGFHRFGRPALFGAFLLFTAWKVWTAEDEEPDPNGNGFMRWIGSRVPTSPHYDGTKLRTRIAGRRALTPMAMVMLAAV